MASQRAQSLFWLCLWACWDLQRSEMDSYWEDAFAWLHHPQRGSGHHCFGCLYQSQQYSRPHACWSCECVSTLSNFKEEASSYLRWMVQSWLETDHWGKSSCWTSCLVTQSSFSSFSSSFWPQMKVHSVSRPSHQSDSLPVSHYLALSELLSSFCWLDCLGACLKKLPKHLTRCLSSWKLISMESHS